MTMNYLTDIDNATGGDTFYSGMVKTQANMVIVDGYLESFTSGNGFAKNLLINGDFSVAQRGTSFTSATSPANSDDTFLLDRWILLSDGNDAVDVSQQADGGVVGTAAYVRLDVETVSKKFGIFQVIENKNCKSILGESVSLSFEAKVTNATKLSDIRAVVLSWASTADSVTSDVVTTWAAEGTVITPAANWTAENVAANLAVTTSWVKYRINNISIDTASAANVGVLIYQNNVATNDTAGIYLDITNVQLELGTAATDFEYRQFGDELVRCKRYYEKSYDYGTAPGTVTDIGRFIINYGALANADFTAYVSVDLPIEMRTTPTIAVYDSAGTVAKVSMPAGNGIAANIGDQGTKGFLCYGTNGAAATTRFIAFQWTASAEL